MESPPAAEQPIRVLIVDDHEMFASSLSVVLEAEQDIIVVGVATSARAGLEMALGTLPDVVLLDQRLPDADGVSVIRPLLDARAGLHVVMVTGSANDQVLVTAIEAGAAGFVDKTRSVGEVVAAVRKLLGALGTVFWYAVRSGYVDVNPTQGVAQVLTKGKPEDRRLP